MAKMEICAAVEVNGGTLDPMCAELMGKGRELASMLDAGLSAVVVGAGFSEAIGEVARCGADTVYKIEHESLAEFKADLWADALCSLCRDVNPKILLMPHTGKFSQIAPRLAFRLGTGVVTDCVDLEIETESGALLVTKPVLGGNAMAVFIDRDSPHLVTVRKNVFSPLKTDLSTAGRIVDFQFRPDKKVDRIEIVEFVREEAVSFDKADVIVSGGRGLGGAEGFRDLEDMAETLRKRFETVMVGCSRPAVDLGWVSANRQIGLTGEIVSPEVYFAVGISGAVQHLIGMIKSRKIVAINTDPNATIFTVSDYGAVGDYKKIIPSFQKKWSRLCDENL